MIRQTMFFPIFFIFLNNLVFNYCPNVRYSNETIIRKLIHSQYFCIFNDNLIAREFSDNFFCTKKSLLQHSESVTSFDLRLFNRLIQNVFIQLNNCSKFYCVGPHCICQIKFYFKHHINLWLAIHSSSHIFIYRS